MADDDKNKLPNQPFGWADFKNLVESFRSIAGRAVHSAGEFGSSVSKGFGFPSVPSPPDNFGPMSPKLSGSGKADPPSRSQNAGDWLGKKMSDFLDRVRGSPVGSGRDARLGGTPGPMAQLGAFLKDPSLKSFGQAGGSLASSGWPLALASVAIPAMLKAIPGADTLSGMGLRMFGPQIAGGAAKAVFGSGSALPTLISGGIGAFFKGQALLGAGKGMARGFGAAMNAGAAGDNMGALSGGIRGVGAAAGTAAYMFGGPIGGFAVNKLFDFGAKLTDSIKKLRDWTEHLHESNMKFAEFSASMSRVEAEQEVRDIRYSRERGNVRAESADLLARRKSQFDRDWAWIGDASAVAGNLVGSAGLSTADVFMKSLTPHFIQIIKATTDLRKVVYAATGGPDTPALIALITRVLKKFDVFAGGAVDGTGLGAQMAEMGEKHWAEVFGRPGR